MKKTLFYLSFLVLIACNNRSETTEHQIRDKETTQIDLPNKVVVEKEQTAAVSNSPVVRTRPQLSLWVGIKTKDFSNDILFCDFLKIKKEKQLKTAIKKILKCKNLDNTSLSDIVGEIRIQKFKKDYDLTVFIFKKDKTTIKEIPQGTGVGNLGSIYKPIQLENKKVKAYLSSELLRIYLNNEQKILISSSMLDQQVREIPADNSQELIELGNLIVKRISE